MKKILITGTMLMAVPFTSFAQTATTTATPVAATTTATTTVVAVNPGLVPGDFFYFLDSWTEALNLALTFNKEKKAKLHLEYAKERVAEMDKVLSNPEAKIADIADAKTNFDTQVANAAAIVKEEKAKGVDVSGLAREIDDELDASRNELKTVFKDYKENSSRAEDEIRAKIAALTAEGAATSTNASALKGLTQALESITKEKSEAEKEEGDVDANLSDEQATLEEVMGTKLSAEKHMEQAAHLRDTIEQGLPAEASAESEKFLKEAERAMKRGDFEAAKNMSKEAERSFENAMETNTREQHTEGMMNASSSIEAAAPMHNEGTQSSERTREGDKMMGGERESSDRENDTNR